MRSPFYEAALIKQGVAFEYVEKVDLADIDRARSLRNQARLEQPIDDALVAQYTQAVKDGDQFPPLVAWRPGRGRAVLIDGNQRLHAYLAADRKRTDVYLVQTADEMVVDRLTWSFNNLVNGKRISQEEALRHAVSWVRKYGRPTREAAKEWGLPFWKVQKAARVEGVKETLQRRNVERASSLSDDLLDEIAPLTGLGEDLTAKAAKLVTENGLQPKDVREVVRAVQAAKTSEEKAAVLDEAAASPEVVQRRAETKGGTVKSPRGSVRVRFRVALVQLRNMLEDHGKAVRPPAGREFSEVQEAARDVADKLVALFGLGARKEAQ